MKDNPKEEESRNTASGGAVVILNRITGGNPYLLLLGIIFIIYCIISVSFSSIGFPDRLFVDNYDFISYNLWGKWIEDNSLPYSGGYFYDYPQIPVYLTGIILYIERNFNTFVLTLKIIFGIFSFLGIIVIDRHLDEVGGDRNLILIYLIPGMLFFSFCRFESISVLFITLSLYFLKKGRYTVSAVFLALSVWVKWYTFLFAPLYINYLLRGYRNRKIGFIYGLKIIRKPLTAFILTSAIVIFPSLIPMSPESVLSGYFFQFTKGTNPEGITSLIKYFFGIDLTLRWDLGFIVIDHPVMMILQFTVLPVSLFIRIKDYDNLVTSGLFAIQWFIIFSKLQSPQWILWIFPLMPFTSEFRGAKETYIPLMTGWGITNYIIFVWQYPDQLWWNIILIMRYFFQISIFLILLRNVRFGRTPLISALLGRKRHR